MTITMLSAVVPRSARGASGQGGPRRADDLLDMDDVAVPDEST